MRDCREVRKRAVAEVSDAVTARIRMSIPASRLLCAVFIASVATTPGLLRAADPLIRESHKSRRVGFSPPFSSRTTKMVG
jgi:hypothetical protein